MSTREMTDCPAWEPVGDDDGIHRPCAACGSKGADHYPAAFLQGLGLSAAGAKRVVKAVARTLDEG